MNNMGAEGGGNYCNGGGGSAVLQVKVEGKDRVAAVLPLQEHWLPLSNLDLLLPPLDVGVFFCYKNNNDADYDFVTVTAALKASLAQTLVTYYPFAGEVVTNSTGEPELLCNNRGVDFITAYADVDLRDLNLHNPDDTVDNKLIPNKMMIKGEEDNHGSVLCIQATALKCGGMVLACTFDHRISDAYSANMFLVAWAEIALNNIVIAAANSSSSSEERRNKPPAAAAVAPTFRRSLLCPRRSGSHDTSALDRLYVPVSSMRPPPSDHQPSSAVVLNRIYYIAAADIEKMQMEATADDHYYIGGRRKRSKLEAFSAYLWRLVAAAVAKKQKQMQVCRMGIVVNGRYRMKPPELLANYFGNVLSIPYGTLGVQDLQMMGLSEVTDRVHQFMQDATTEEHFLGLIDWVEARRPEPAVARIYCNGRTTTAEGEEEEEEGIAFVVSSGRGFPVAELDFGWGRPVFGSYHFPWGDSAGYVMPMPSARANGDWVVYMHLLDDVIEAVESNDIFCPLTPDYLLLDHHHHHHL
ncbi:transferase [Iris pallida]|uniref:Transferase n=1 Tax=Iris pallida TaxID=29817 RepID=A0AAX6G1N3_IRIPA|nr:transferase [Iris pallida]